MLAGAVVLQALPEYTTASCFRVTCATAVNERNKATSQHIAIRMETSVHRKDEGEWPRISILVPRKWPQSGHFCNAISQRGLPDQGKLLAVLVRAVCAQFFELHL